MPDSGSFPPVDATVVRHPFPHRFSFWQGGVRSTVRAWRHYIQEMRIPVDQMFAAKAYDLVLGIDSEGIIKGYEYAKRFHISHWR